MKKLKNIISNTLKINDFDENFDLNTEDVDSFKKLTLIMEIEKQFKIEINIIEALEINYIKDFIDILIKKGIDKNEI